jgi:hypothetical protein
MIAGAPNTTSWLDFVTGEVRVGIARVGEELVRNDDVGLLVYVAL